MLGADWSISASRDFYQCSAKLAFFCHSKNQKKPSPKYIQLLSNNYAKIHCYFDAECYRDVVLEIKLHNTKFERRKN